MKKKILTFCITLLATTAYADDFSCSLISRVGGKTVDFASTRLNLFDGMQNMVEIVSHPVYASAAVKQIGARIMLEVHEDIQQKPLKIVVVEGSVIDDISYFRSNSNGTSLTVRCSKITK